MDEKKQVEELNQIMENLRKICSYTIEKKKQQNKNKLEEEEKNVIAS